MSQTLAAEMRCFGGMIIRTGGLLLSGQRKKKLKLADSVRNNNFLKRYISLLEELGNLPASITREVVIEKTDRNNMTCTVDSIGIRIALIDGHLAVFPRISTAPSVMCSRGIQTCYLFDANTAKWTISCVTSFDVIKARLKEDKRYKENVFSLKESKITDVVSALNFLFEFYNHGHD